MLRRGISPEVTDAELILASRDDPRAFRELYDRWAERLLAYFYRRVLDAEVAADLLAETFAVAFERRHRFRDVGRPGGAWLYGIAAKELSHWFRRQEVERRAVRRMGLQVPALVAESIARIEALVDADEHRAALAAALEQMTGGERDAVRLRVVGELGYVRDLGDALERAAASAPQKRGGLLRGRRPRRRAAILAFAILLAASAVTTAAIVSDPDELAIGSVGCSESGDPDLGAEISVLDGRSPVAVCAEVWTDRGQAAPPLVACHSDRGVFVFPGVGPEACRSAGLAELPAGYQAAEARVARLVRDVAAVEEASDCIAPAELARRLQQVLRDTGWTGWRAVAGGVSEGPCGWARRRGGDSRLTLSPALDSEARVLLVGGGPPRSLERQLHGESSILIGLFEDTGERCYGLAELEQHVRREAAVTGREVRIKLGRMPANTGMEPPRGDRLAEGCAIVVGASAVYPASGEVAVEVEIWQGRGP